MTKFGIGQAVRRVEDQRFTTGGGEYVSDLELPRQCFGAQVLSPHAHAAIKSIDARTHMLSSQKARWRRSLNETQAQWVSWRDSECQDVAPFEAGMGAKGGDPRLSCIIDQNARRVADIKARYP